MAISTRNNRLLRGVRDGARALTPEPRYYARLNRNRPAADAPSPGTSRPAADAPLQLQFRDSAVRPGFRDHLSSEHDAGIALSQHACSGAHLKSAERAG